MKNEGSRKGQENPSKMSSCEVADSDHLAAGAVRRRHGACGDIGDNAVRLALSMTSSIGGRNAGW